MTTRIEKIYFSSPVWLQNVLVSAMGYKLYRKRYTGIYHNVKELVARSRNWSETERDAYQSERLHNLVRHCHQCIPYYQALFAEHGLHPNDITHVNDLIKLPILTKKSLQQNGEAFRLRGRKPFMIQHTSGSTGTPLALHVNEYTYKMAMALLVDHEEFHGIPFGARRATFAGRMLKQANDMAPPFSRYNRAENQRLYSSYHLNEKTFPYYRDELNRFRPQEIIGYPSAIADLAAQYQQANSKPDFQVTAIITNSETLLEWQRERIEAVFNCKVRDYYGTAEYVTFAGQDKNGVYQTNPAIGITEVVFDGANAHSGKVVATTLTNDLMPLLRYEIGDTATVFDEHSQNVRQDRLQVVNGRIDDYIKTADGRLIGRIDHIFKGLEGIHEAQVVQDSLTHCTIRVVTQTPPEQFDRRKLIDNMRFRTGDSMEISIEFLPSIPRGANGKFRSVVSLRQISGAA